MKRIGIFLLSGLLVIGLFVGCAPKQEKGDKLSVVTTIFPIYDWVSEIIGDSQNIEITMLLDDSVDLHSFQPTVDDIVKIASCDMFIYLGGESDAWVEDALKEATNKDMIVINLLEVLGDAAKEEEFIEGMEAGEDSEIGEGDTHLESEEEEPEWDEHIWLSIKNAIVLCREIERELVNLDKEQANLFQENTQNYLSLLEELDAEYSDCVLNANKNCVVFGDRFPFRYLVDDYEIDYYAAFVGCSAETEASFETIIFLAEKVDELGLTAILQNEDSKGRIAETIRENTMNKDQEILTMDSMQSVTSKDVSSGVTYLKVMKNNLDILRQALK